MSKTYDVAVVGATGAVGETMMRVLEERNFPVGTLYPLASERSEGKIVQFKGKNIRVQNLAEFDFSKVSLSLFSAGGAISGVHAPRAVEAGCVVIDNTSHFRTDPDIPLVVPEVNPHALRSGNGIIANPNCWRFSRIIRIGFI